MLLNELTVACHLRSTLFRYYGKLLENNGLRLKWYLQGFFLERILAVQGG